MGRREKIGSVLAAFETTIAKNNEAGASSGMYLSNMVNHGPPLYSTSDHSCSRSRVKPQKNYRLSLPDKAKSKTGGSVATTESSGTFSSSTEGGDSRFSKSSRSRRGGTYKLDKIEKNSASGRSSKQQPTANEDHSDGSFEASELFDFAEEPFEDDNFDQVSRSNSFSEVRRDPKSALDTFHNSFASLNSSTSWTGDDSFSVTSDSKRRGDAKEKKSRSSRTTTKSSSSSSRARSRSPKPSKGSSSSSRRSQSPKPKNGTSSRTRSRSPSAKSSSRRSQSPKPRGSSKTREGSSRRSRSPTNRTSSRNTTTAENSKMALQSSKSRRADPFHESLLSLSCSDFDAFTNQEEDTLHFSPEKKAAQKTSSSSANNGRLKSSSSSTRMLDRKSRPKAVGVVETPSLPSVQSAKAMFSKNQGDSDLFKVCSRNSMAKGMKAGDLSKLSQHSLPSSSVSVCSSRKESSSGKSCSKLRAWPTGGSSVCTNNSHDDDKSRVSSTTNTRGRRTEKQQLETDEDTTNNSGSFNFSDLDESFNRSSSALKLAPSHKDRESRRRLSPLRREKTPPRRQLMEEVPEPEPVVPKPVKLRSSDPNRKSNGRKRLTKRLPGSSDKDNNNNDSCDAQTTACGQETEKPHCSDHGDGRRIYSC